MSIEIKMLVWSIVLGLVHILLASIFVTRQRGLKWNAGARDGVAEPLVGIAGRLDRASRNFLETFVFFAVVVVALQLTGKSDAQTMLGAQLYFWARLVYLPVYAAGIPYLRTLVWAVSVAGLVLLLCGLF
ncbi:MAG TPA: MAPEG family protein [Dokdonella sp.]|uniref:MAPEG family protein n=1 Tax=Dokdonella sp. TaxID=2291710 RepID=UPI002D807678|nr:MAPEG family protein [Dokdonella sp.]HET9031684.1 MAPEG family protein [Dokdonella sp.]